MLKMNIKNGLSILSILLLTLSLQAQAKKRYKQRNHKLQTAGHLNTSADNEITGTGSVSYAKNWGYFELGGGLNIMPNEMGFGEFFKKLGLELFLSGEGNFIKNKRKNNWVPGFGLQAAYRLGNEIFLTPYLVSKHFISYRTSINVSLGYPLKVYEWGSNWYRNGVQIMWSYAYYFH